MKDITIKELIDLAGEDVSNPDENLIKVYEWHYERKMTMIKGSIGVAISLVVSLIIAYFEADSEENNFNHWEVLVPVCISFFLIMSYGFYELYKIRKLGNNFVGAIILLNKFKSIKPFIKKYRSSKIRKRKITKVKKK
jgi:hypothetical protein